MDGMKQCRDCGEVKAFSEFMKKKQEDAQIVAAKGQSSAEQKAWGAG